MYYLVTVTSSCSQEHGWGLIVELRHMENPFPKFWRQTILGTWSWPRRNKRIWPNIKRFLALSGPTISTKTQSNFQWCRNRPTRRLKVGHRRCLHWSIIQVSSGTGHPIGSWHQKNLPWCRGLRFSLLTLGQSLRPLPNMLTELGLHSLARLATLWQQGLLEASCSLQKIYEFQISEPFSAVL